MVDKKDFIADNIEEIYSGNETISCIEVIDREHICIGTQRGSLVLITSDGKEIVGRSKIAKSGINTISGWDDGVIIAGSTKGSVCLLDKELYRLGKFRGHDDGVFAVAQGKRDGRDIFATGGGDGTWKLWDRRCLKPIITEKIHTDYISGLRFAEEDRLLISSSGDSLVSIYNQKKGAVQTILPTMESEITCMGMIPGISLAVGTLSGKITIFKWGSWDEPHDRFSFPKNEIDSIDADQNHGYVAGIANGKVVQLNPNNHNTWDLFRLAPNGPITVRGYISAENQPEIIASNHTTRLYKRRQSLQKQSIMKEDFFSDLL